MLLGGHGDACPLVHWLVFVCSPQPTQPGYHLSLKLAAGKLSLTFAELSLMLAAGKLRLTFAALSLTFAACKLLFRQRVRACIHRCTSRYSVAEEEPRRRFLWEFTMKAHVVRH